MPKPITPDDIPTNISYTKPEIGWLGHPRLHGFYAERGGHVISDYYPSIFDAVIEYPEAIITETAIAQLSDGEKRMLAKPSEEKSRAGAENLVCLSEKFHTHPNYDEFYERYQNDINGFMGCYGIVIDMAEVLTDWEDNKGGRDLYDEVIVIWDDFAQEYVDRYFETALASRGGMLPDETMVFKMIEPPLNKSRNLPNRPTSVILSDPPEP